MDDFLPLDGIRVLAPETNWAGPWATKILADLGAEVIRVESIQRYDPSRGPLDREDWRAYGNRGSGLPPIERADTYLKPNRNKLDITINLKSPVGVSLFHRLAAISDVVLDNFGTGTMDGLGIGYEALRRVNPELIVLSMPMMGVHGPESRYQGYGSATEVLGGLTYLTGYEGGGPELSSFLFGDPVAGINAASALLLALLHRAETGEGQFVDLSQVEVVASYTGDAIMHYVLRGENPTRRGNAHDAYAPHGVYRCYGEDRWVAIAVTTDEEWDALSRAMGDAELLGDEALRSGPGRIEQQKRIDSRIEAWTAERDSIDVSRILQEAGVPAGTVATSQDLYEDPHLAAREYFEPVTQQLAGTHLYPGAGWKMSLTSQRSRLPSPRLGEHNNYVLHSLLGLSSEEMQTLADTQVIGVQPLVDVWAG